MKHKTSLFLAGFLLASTLSSCVVAPVPGGPVAARRPHSPYSPGGRYVTPRERYARSPYSPGGVVVLPREARPVAYRGVNYHTHGGLWYRPSGRGHVIVARPY